MSTTSEIDNATHRAVEWNSDSETGDVPVTSLTAKTLDPGRAVATVIKNQEGLLYSLWRVVVFLLFEALGLNILSNHKATHENYENVDLDKYAARGRFPYRPSDLFLKVELMYTPG